MSNQCDTDVVIIGAGLAGLTAASRLHDTGLRCTVVEKARGPGGRMSTRRHQEWRFDHGAQYFTVRDAAFGTVVDGWLASGRVCRWNARIGVIEGGLAHPAGRGTERLVGVPGMSAPCSALAAGLPDIRFQWEATRCTPTPEGWIVRSSGRDTLEARSLVVTAPPRQAANLLGTHRLVGSLESVRMAPCWAVLAVFEAPLLPDWDAAFVNDGPLSWIAAQSSRPGRPDAEAWVLHAAADWTDRHLEADPAQVTGRLLDAAGMLPGASMTECRFATAHRWRHALADQPLDAGCLWDPDDRLAIAGDWCQGSRVEGAFLSGRAAAERILGG